MAGVYPRGRVWYSDIYIHGERIRKPLSTDRRIAEQRLADLIKQRDGLRYGHAASGISFSAFRNKLLAQVKSRGSKVTHTQYERAFRDIHLERVSQLTPEYAEHLIAEWQRDGIGKYEINARLRSIKAGMRRAEVWGYCQPQRWESVHPIKTPRGRLLWYTMDEFKHLLSVCRGPWHSVAMLGAYAGLRRSEIAALRWQDVDFERFRIHVTPYQGFNPKDYERRWIPMHKSLGGYLGRLEPKQGLVLGRKYHAGVLTTYMRRLSKEAGLAGAVHTLRHTFGAWMASGGCPLFTLAKLMGHSTTKRTEIYAHLAPDQQQSAVNVMPPLVV